MCVVFVTDFVHRLSAYIVTTEHTPLTELDIRNRPTVGLSIHTVLQWGFFTDNILDSLMVDQNIVFAKVK